jgi:hypothetical protein
MLGVRNVYSFFGYRDLTHVQGLEAIFETWQNHDYLQRCHIVPKSLGGCNCAANLVLLCRKCHKASPDTRDPVHFVTWVRNRNKFIYREIKATMEAAEYVAEKEDHILFYSKEFDRYVDENVVFVGSSIALSSVIAAFIEFKETLSSDDCSRIFEEFHAEKHFPKQTRSLPLPVLTSFDISAESLYCSARNSSQI